MDPSASGTESLVITVGGDIAPLQHALAGVPAQFAGLTTAVHDSFAGIETASKDVSESLANLGTAAGQSVGVLANDLQEVAGAAEAAAVPVTTLGDELEAVGAAPLAGLPEVSNELDGLAGAADGAAGAADGLAGAAGQLPGPLGETADAAKHASESTHELFEALTELAGITLSLEAFKEVIVGSLEAFGEFQRAGEALKAVTGNAKEAAEAMERIPALANAIGQSIPSLEQAQQRFALYGVELGKIPGVLESIANASIASNRSFDQVANSFERIANTGTVNVRMLQQTGLTVADLGKALGLTDASIKDVSEAMKDFGTGAEAATQRTQVLIDATARYGGLAKTTATDVEGSWQQIKNAVHEAMVNVGDTLSGLTGVVQTFKDVLAGLVIAFDSIVGVAKVAADAFIALGGVTSEVFTGIGKAALDTLKGNFKAAIDDVQEGTTRAYSYLASFGENVKKDWEDTASKVTKLVTDTGTAMDATGKAASGAADKVKGVGDAAKGAADGLSKLGGAAKDTLSTFTAALEPSTAAFNKYIDSLSQAQRNARDLGIELLDGTKPGVDAVAAGIEVLRGAADMAGTSFADLSRETVDFDTAMQDGIYQTQKEIDALRALAAQAPGTASALEGVAKAADDVGSAATEAAGAADNLASAVQSVSEDFASEMGGQTAPMSFHLKPGDVISYLTGTGALGGFFGGTRANVTYDPANSPAALAAKAIDDAARAAGMVWTHKGWQMPAATDTNASGVTSSFQALIDQTGKLTSNLRVTTDQMSSWDRAQMYAADNAKKAADALNTVAQTATVAAGGVAALSNSTQVAIAATTNAISGLVAMVAGVTGGAIGSMGAPQIGAPSIGGRQPSTGGTGSGAGDQGFIATHPWLYGLSAAPSMNVTVDVSGSTIVGQQAMSNLSDTVANAMVGKLATMGIRLTRQ